MTEKRTIPLGTSGSTIETLAAPTETAATVSLYRWRMSPASRGPAPHFHTTFSETFIVETGELDYFDGQQWRTLRPGQVMHCAVGNVHGLRKEQDEPATVLMALTPGVPREEYFAQLAGADERDLDGLHEAHDNHFVDDGDT